MQPEDVAFLKKWLSGYQAKVRIMGLEYERN